MLSGVDGGVSSCFTSSVICDHTCVEPDVAWPGLGTGSHIECDSGDDPGLFGIDPVSGVAGGSSVYAICDNISVNSGDGWSRFVGTWPDDNHGLSGVGEGLSVDGICANISVNSGDGWSRFIGTWTEDDPGLSGAGEGLPVDGICANISVRSSGVGDGG